MATQQPRKEQLGLTDPVDPGYSGGNLVRIGGAALVVLAISGVGAWWFTKSPEEPKRMAANASANVDVAQGKRMSYDDVKADDKQTASAAASNDGGKQADTGKAADTGKDTGKGGGKEIERDPLYEQALQASFGGFDNKQQQGSAGGQQQGGQQGDPAQRSETVHPASYRKPDNRPAGQQCKTNSGTKATLLFDHNIRTASGGTVRARLVEDIWGSNGSDCKVLTYGSTFVGIVNAKTAQGQENADIVFFEINRGGEKTGSIKMDLAAHDAQGRGGVGGRVDSNIGGRLASLGLAIGFDALTVATTGVPFGTIGSLLGTAESPLNEITREQWRRPSTIEIDAGTEITVMFQKDIYDADFR